MYFIETRNSFNKPEYFDEILSKRYKDTPFAIIKEKIGKMWTVYIIIDDNRICGYMQYYTKGSAIKEIEEGNIYRAIRSEFVVLNYVHNTLNNYYDKTQIFCGEDGDYDDYVICRK